MKLAPIVLGVALLATAAAADRVVPPRDEPPPGIVPTAPSGGVLSCPTATTKTAEGRLYLANVGDSTGRARVFIRPAKGKAITQRLGLVAGQIEVIDLSKLTKDASGLAVEWSGGKIIAAHSLHSYRRSILPGRSLPRFMSAAQCFEVLGPVVTIAGARTTQLGDTNIALFNPGPAPADVSIAIRAGGRYSRPQRLQHRIVRPLSRRDFSIREFAFGSQDITAVITMNSGRVVAEGYVETRGGAELISAVPPLSEALALIGTSGEGVRMSLASAADSLGTDPATGDPIEIPVGLEADRYADGVEVGRSEVPLQLESGVPSKVDVPAFNGRGQVGYELRPLAGTIAASVSWQTQGERVFDLVASSAAQPVNSWFALLPAFGPAWRVDLVVAASGGQDGEAEMRVLGRNARTETLDLPPGTVRRVPVSSGPGVTAVVLTSDIPIGATFVARSGAIAYGTLPTWLRVATATALDPQPVVGIGRGQP